MALIDKPKARAGRGRSDERPVTYAEDNYTWALQQAALLRARDFAALDADQLVEEIMDVAHDLVGNLRSDLARVIQHMLKWDHQPERRSRSWALSIREHRARVAQHLSEGPGLRGILEKTLEQAYQSGRNAALIETNLPEKTLPTQCPYAWDEIITRPFDWPEAA